MSSAISRSRSYLLLILLTVAAYAPALSNSFVWDDHSLIQQNSFIRNPAYLPAIFTSDLFHSYNSAVATHYRPLQAVTYMVDYAIWGENPFGYHLTNLLLHLSCVLLLAGLIERWSENRLVALGVASLFAVHPVNANAIAYIAGRADPMALGAMLGALLLLHRYWKLPETALKSRALFYAFAMVCFVAGLFSRENALLFPLLVLIVLALLPGAPRPSIRQLFPLLLMAVLFYYWHHEVLRLQDKPLQAGAALPGVIRLQVLFRSIAVYCGLLIWPATLQMERQVVAGGTGLHWLTAAGAVILIIFGGLLVWTRKRVPLAFLGLVWFLATLAPQLGLLNLNASVAEHWLYLPSIGIYLALAAIAWHYWPTEPVRQKALWGVFGVVIAALMTRTIVRDRDWSTPVTLFTQTTKLAPLSPFVKSNLGTELAAAGQPDRALTELKAAEKMDPGHARLKANLARFFYDQGNMAAAAEKIQESLALEPNNTMSLMLQADVRNRLGDVRGANASFIRAEATTLDIRPRLQHAMFQLEHHQLGLALALAQEARQLEPASAPVHNLLGIILSETGEMEPARRAFEYARTLDRHSPDADINLGKLANRQQDFAGAEAAYQRAVERQAGNPVAHYLRGVNLWQNQQWEAARDELEIAVEIAPNSQPAIRALERIKNREPYRSSPGPVAPPMVHPAPAR